MQSFEIVGSGEHHEMEWNITTNAVTLLKNEGDALPVKDSEKVVVAIFSILGGCKIQGRIPVDIPALNDKYEYTDEVLYHRGDGLILE